MFIDQTTYMGLHLQSILETISPVSDLGKKYKQNLSPFRVGEETAVTFAYSKIEPIYKKIKKNPEFIDELSGLLNHIESVDLILRKLKSNCVLELFEIQLIKQFLYFSLALNKVSENHQLFSLSVTKDVEKLFQFLDPQNQNTTSFHLDDSFSEKLASLRANLLNIEKDIKQEKRKILTFAAAKLNRKKVPETITVSRFDDATYQLLQKAEFFYLKSENFANYTFGIKKSDAIISLEKELILNQNKIISEEESVREMITIKIQPFVMILERLHKEIGEIDWVISKAIFALNNNAVMPIVSKSLTYEITKAVNLPVSWKLHKEDITYQPINISFQQQLNVLTGANMAGKSTLLKTLGQLQFLLNYAIPLPCEKAELSLVDFIFLSGVQEERMDLSSFGTEIVHLNNMLQKDGYGLFLVDEFARGTNPQEGEALSKAMLEQFSDKSCMLLYATHFQSPTSVQKAEHFQISGIAEKDFEKIKHQASNDMKERLEIIHRYMDYQLIKVKPDTIPPRAALLIAEMLGVESHIIETAEKYLLQ